MSYLFVGDVWYPSRFDMQLLFCYHSLNFWAGNIYCLSMLPWLLSFQFLSSCLLPYMLLQLSCFWPASMLVIGHIAVVSPSVNHGWILHCYTPNTSSASLVKMDENALVITSRSQFLSSRVGNLPLAVTCKALHVVKSISLSTLNFFLMCKHYLTFFNFRFKFTMTMSWSLPMMLPG